MTLTLGVYLVVCWILVVGGMFGWWRVVGLLDFLVEICLLGVWFGYGGVCDLYLFVWV